MEKLKKLKILYLNGLSFEVTRRCNQQCKHCMCGPMQNIDISYKVIDAFFEQCKTYDVVIINELFFTGGEPLLNIDAINYILHKISTSRVEIIFNHFGIKTNGLLYTKEIEEILYKLYNSSEQPTRCWLTCSLDQFHKKPSEDNLNKYKKLPFFDGIEDQFLKKSDILNTGLARKNNLGCSMFGNDINLSKSPIKYIKRIEKGEEFLVDKTHIIDYININCKGYILANIDGSYLFQDNFNKGNILVDNIIDISKDITKKISKITKIKTKRKICFYE